MTCIKTWVKVTFKFRRKIHNYAKNIDKRDKYRDSLHITLQGKKTKPTFGTLKAS